MRHVFRVRVHWSYLLAIVPLIVLWVIVAPLVPRWSRAALVAGAVWAAAWVVYLAVRQRRGVR